VWLKLRGVEAESESGSRHAARPSRAGKGFALASSFARGSAGYWFDAHRRAVAEARHWRLRATAIGEPRLRAFALQTHERKGESLEAMAVFAAFVGPDARADLVRAVVAYQVAFDYIDTVTEAVADPIPLGRGLNAALVDALQTEPPLGGYWGSWDGADDGGYLLELVETVRRSVHALPGFPSVAGVARAFAERIVAYQSLNHGDGAGSFEAFGEWGRSQVAPDTDLYWWEAAAAGGSTLPVFALLSAATRPGLGEAEVRRLARAYDPWVSALGTLLDSLVDDQQDADHGHHSLVSYYRSPEEAASRLARIAGTALELIGGLPDWPQHQLILAGMAGFFHSSPQARSSAARLGTTLVRDGMGGLAWPMTAVFFARRLARAAGEGRPALARRTLGGRGSDEGDGPAARPDPASDGSASDGYAPDGRAPDPAGVD